MHSISGRLPRLYPPSGPVCIPSSSQSCAPEWVRPDRRAVYLHRGREPLSLKKSTCRREAHLTLPLSSKLHHMCRKTKQLVYQPTERTRSGPAAVRVRKLGSIRVTRLSPTIKRAGCMCRQHRIRIVSRYVLACCYSSTTRSSLPIRRAHSALVPLPALLPPD